MMRQLCDGGHVRPRLKTPDAGSQSSSDIRIISGPVSMKVNRPVCLPVLSKDNKLLWVYSRQIDELQLELVEELDKAFDRFPYLTKKQTAALAQRCSLHPDQVKVWFMAQRLQCGVSWDYEDICEMWNNFKSNHKDGEENEEIQNWGAGEIEDDRRQKKNPKDKKGESGEKGEKEGRMTEQKVRANRQKTKTAKSKKVKEDNANTPKEQKVGPVTDKKRKRDLKKDDDTERAANVEVNRDESENEGQTCTESQGAVFTKRKRIEEKEQVKTAYENPVEFDLLLGGSSVLKPSAQTFLIIPATENLTDPQERADILHTIPDKSPVNGSSEETTKGICLEEDPQAEATDQNNVVPDEDKMKDLTTVNISDVAEHPPSTQTCTTKKTEAQRMMMKTAFFHCQYPDSFQYTYLAQQIGIPRSSLVQWYSDMRYSLKRSKPRWMNDEKYKQVLTNIKYRQSMIEQSKLQLSFSD